MSVLTTEDKSDWKLIRLEIHPNQRTGSYAGDYIVPVYEGFEYVEKPTGEKHRVGLKEVRGEPLYLDTMQTMRADMHIAAKMLMDVYNRAIPLLEDHFLLRDEVPKSTLSKRNR